MFNIYKWWAYKIAPPRQNANKNWLKNRIITRILQKHTEKKN